MEEPYTKREIDLLHEPLHKKLDTIIKAQKFTNGKVKKIILVLVALAFYVLGVSDVGLTTLIKIIA